jgi:hypothetical protein
MSQSKILPEEVRSKLKTDPRYTSGNELLPAEVAATMYKHDRPVWTASQMQAELDTGHGRETVRDKLNKLDELEICRSMSANNGRIYWWNDNRSNWPIPPDVVVEGQQELTVSELLSPWYAKIGLLGLLGPVIAGLPLLVGIFEIGGTISTPIPGTELLTWGMTMIIASYTLLVYACLVGGLYWTTGGVLKSGLLNTE